MTRKNDWLVGNRTGYHISTKSTKHISTKSTKSTKHTSTKSTKNAKNTVSLLNYNSKRALALLINIGAIVIILSSLDAWHPNFPFYELDFKNASISVIELK